MEKFAKLFESEKLGQLVVLNQTNDEGAPEVRIFFTADGLGVSSMAFSFHDTEKCQNNADTLFSDMKLEYWEKLVGGALTECGVL